MPETPKKKCKVDKHEKDAHDEASWSEEQKNHEYYYDDAHGYEIFNPDNEDEDEPAAE